MHVQLIGFAPPIEGVDGEFNTFRLGIALSKRLRPGQEVFLMEEKAKIVFGRALVKAVHTGTLMQLCLLHAKENHREKGKPDPDHACQRLFEYLQKLYGPQIATETKRTTVVYLQRLPNGIATSYGHHALREAQGPDGGEFAQGGAGVFGVAAADAQG
jgi:hypothetical protein